ncbi:MAG: MATE family efflux transporter, partial [Phycisphaerales bacterium]|nr:MATE family efflux transporter [Phycisphaerales bacterium]
MTSRKYTDADPPVTGPSGAGPVGGVRDDRVIKSGKLKGLSMRAAIWLLAWPVLIESFLNALVGMVDTTLSASLSVEATDAVGAASYFVWLIGLVGMALGVGVTALVSRSMGKGRPAVANAALGQAALLGLGGGALVSVVLWVCAPLVARVLNLDGEVARQAVEYLRILAVAVPMQTWLVCGIAGARGAGDAVSPLLMMAGVNVVNIVTSFVLSGASFGYTRPGAAGDVVTTTIIANPFGFQWGLAGIAWGTVIAWTTGAVAMMVLLGTRGVHGLRLRARRLKPHVTTMKRLIRVGTPNLIETAGMWFGNFLVIVLVGLMGGEGLFGSHIVAIRIEAFSFLPGFAMSMAAATLAGQYLGAMRPDLARKAILRCTAIATSIMVLFGMAFAFAPRYVVGVFTQQPVHMELVPRLLFICAFIQAPFAISICIRGALRGTG